MDILDSLSIGFCEIDKKMRIKKYNSIYEHIIQSKLKMRKNINDFINDELIIKNFRQASNSKNPIIVIKNNIWFKYEKTKKEGAKVTVISLDLMDKQLSNYRHNLKNALNPLILNTEYTKIKNIIEHIDKLDVSQICSSLFP